MPKIALYYKVKHFLSGRRVRCAVASMGGVGSTALARHVGSLADKTPREHAYTPMLYAEDAPLKLAYVFGDPYNAVLSVFRRGYQDMHARAMNAHSETPPANLKGMTIAEYLERGIDEIRIERQVDNWVNAAACPHPILLIKYEALARNLGQVLEYFESSEPYEVLPRRTGWEEEPEPIRRGLEKLYGPLREKIMALPDLRLIEPRQSCRRMKETPPCPR